MTVRMCQINCSDILNHCESSVKFGYVGSVNITPYRERYYVFEHLLCNIIYDADYIGRPRRKHDVTSKVFIPRNYT